eukprot:scaffold4155_cov165-Amphora_coffeaeformis.AAC.3
MQGPLLDTRTAMNTWLGYFGLVCRASLSRLGLLGGWGKGRATVNRLVVVGRTALPTGTHGAAGMPVDVFDTRPRTDRDVRRQWSGRYMGTY